MPHINQQLNLRLPERTHQQINALCAKTGYTKAQLIIVLVDRAAAQELDEPRVVVVEQPPSEREF